MPYREMPRRELVFTFDADSGFPGAEVVTHDRLTVENGLGLLTRIDMTTAPRPQVRQRVIEWGDAWLVRWNLEEPLVGPDGEPVRDPDGEYIWVPIPCTGAALLQRDPVFWMVLMAKHYDALAPAAVSEVTVDPNSLAPSSNGAHPTDASAPASVVPLTSARNRQERRRTS